MHAHDITAEFERELCLYTGAPYCVTTTSCTMAIFLALQYYKHRQGGALGTVTCPKQTYVSVPMQIVHAGGRIRWVDLDWEADGMYRLHPTPVWDCARVLTSGMYASRSLMCLSFHWSKHLGVQQGGAILTDSRDAYTWLKRARFDGRTERVPPSADAFTMGWHAYLSPEIAAEGLVRLGFLPLHNQPLPWDGYPDLSKQAVFAPHTSADT